MTQLTFYFDYISHNAYLAWHQLFDLIKNQDIQVVLKPVVFGVLLKAHGQMGPAEVRPKNAWMLRDVLRKARIHNIPISPPHAHPFNPLLPLRLTTLPHLDEAQRIELINTLFTATWVDSINVTDEATLVPYLESKGYQDAKKWAEQAIQPENKQRLKQNTEDALSVGVFGVPSMMFKDILYWGFDDFIYLKQAIESQDLVEDMDLGPWYAIKPSVVRKR